MVRLSDRVKASVIALVLSAASAPAPVSAAPGDETMAVALTLVPTIECIGVTASFTGDNNQNNNAVLEYRELPGGAWKQGMPLTVDRRAQIQTSGWSSYVDNPNGNEWRGSILGLDPGTDYEVRVIFGDADGVTGSPLISTTKTRDDSPLIGTNYLYVATNGSDATGDGTEANPWRTIQRAADAVAPGDTVLVRGGTYSETVAVTTSGTEDNYITFMPYPSEQVTLDGNGTLTNLFDIDGADYIRIKGFTLTNTAYQDESGAIRLTNGADYSIIEDNMLVSPIGRAGIMIRYGSSNALIQRNIITANGGPTHRISGVYWWKAGGGNVFRNNTIITTNGGLWDGFGGGPENSLGYMYDSDFYDNTIIGPADDGIQPEGGNVNVRIWNNRIEDFFIGIALAPTLLGPVYVFKNIMVNANGGSGGFKLGDASYGRIYIYHNTFYTVTTGFKQTNHGLGNIVSRNNIIYAGYYVFEMTGSHDFDYDSVYSTNPTRFIEWGGTRYSDLESFRSGAGQELHGTSVADNGFVDPASGDLGLQSTSPLIDAGVILPGFNDANSPWPYKGSAPDIGAYEYDPEAGSPDNGPPVFDPIGNKSVNEGELLEFTVSATDPDGDALTYSASNLPSGASFDPQTRTFTWTPGAGQRGTYSGVRFAVSDGVLTDYEDVTITVINPNNAAPVLNSIGNLTVEEGQTLQFTVSASDPDGDTLTYLASNLPSGASFDAQTGTFSWTPAFNQAGSYSNVHFEVSDGVLTDSEDITIDVADAGNQAPLLSPIGNKTVNEGETLQFTVSATDPDGDTLTYSASNLPSGASFDGQARMFSWTPSAGQAGTYANVRFTVSDGELTDSEDITITVTAPIPLSLPLRVNAGGSAYSDSSGNSWLADQAYTAGSWGHYGPDNTVDRGAGHAIAGTTDDRIYQTERYGLGGYRFDLPNGTYTVVLHFAETYRTGPGERVFDVLIEGQLVLDDLDIYSEVGYSTALTKVFSGVAVQDGQLEIAFSASVEQPEINGIEVVSAGSGGPTNSAPVLNAIGDRAVEEGQTLQFTVSATDPDGDALTYSASNLPSGARFDGQTRTFTWTPSVGQAGTYANVRFTVFDGVVPVSQEITITVTPPPPPPVQGGGSPPPANSTPALDTVGNKLVNVGETLQFTLSASDPDGDALTFSASGLPEGAVLDAKTGTFTWTPSVGQEGSYAVRFTVSDGELTDSEDISITVTPDETGPEIQEVSASVASPYSVEITWTTSEPSTSQVEYWASPGTLSPLDETLVTEHRVRLTGLTSATTYHYRTMSMDAAGNLTVSPEFTFTTAEAPAAFTLGDMEVSPQEAAVGEEVSISVLVTNTGDLAGSYNVTLKIDGVVRATEPVADLSGGESRRVVFSVIAETDGVYEIDINGLTADLVVGEAAMPQPQIALFTVTPVYESDTGRIILASISYQVSGSLESVGSDLALVLAVALDGEPLEEFLIFSWSQSEGQGMESGTRDYAPLQGWAAGRYTFRAELRSADGAVLDAASAELEVSEESSASVVSWATLGVIIGAMLGVSIATVLIVVRRRSYMLRT